MMTPDYEATLRCRIQDLKRDLKYALDFWEQDLKHWEEGDSYDSWNSPKRYSNIIIEEYRKTLSK